MKCAVWKYPVTWGANRVAMPTGSIVLPTVLVQGHQPVIYALVDPKPGVPTDMHLVIVRSTGLSFELPVNHRYLGTFQVPNGDVGHVFEYLD